jgi:hypothetical protein
MSANRLFELAQQAHFNGRPSLTGVNFSLLQTLGGVVVVTTP